MPMRVSLVRVWDFQDLGLGERAVRDLVAGSGLQFEERGTQLERH